MNTTKLTFALSVSLSLTALAAPVDTWYSPEFGPDLNGSFQPERLYWTGNPGSYGELNAATNYAGPQAKSFSVMPYYAYVDYENSSIKKSGNLFGAYGYFGIGQHAFEAEVDHFDLDRKTISNLSQWDLSAAYANYVIPHWRLRLAGHYIVSDDAATDSSFTLTPSAHYYSDTGKWDAGVEAAYSHYPHYGPKLDAFQVAPNLGFVLKQTATYTLRNDAKAYYIHLGEKIGTQRNLYSIEDALSFYWKNWTFSGFGWFGKQTFAVRSEGFVVYNLNEEHKYGAGVEARYAINPHWSANVRYARENYRELGSATDSDMNIFLIGTTVHF